MPTVRIDEEVYRLLEEHVKGFETPNDVLRRLLGLDDLDKGTAEVMTKLGKPIGGDVSKRRKQVSARRIGRGEAMPQEGYRMPILEALAELGGKGSSRQVLERVFPRVRNKLQPADFKKIRSGEIRWENRAKWERKNLVDAGLLREDSPRGVWEISDRGVLYLEKMSTR